MERVQAKTSGLSKGISLPVREERTRRLSAGRSVDLPHCLEVLGLISEFTKVIRERERGEGEVEKTETGRQEEREG